MYCVKCKKKTESNNIIQVQTKNNRSMLKGVCTICGINKSSFVSNKSGKGLINNLINNLPFELHLPTERGEYVPNGSFNNLQKYSYAGPGTKYEQRVREGYEGINELDRMAKIHDQFYSTNLDTKSRNISDIALAHRAEEIARSSLYDDQQRRDANIVKTIMKAKARFGLGVKESKKSKN